MEHELDVGERLQARTETRLRLAHSFGDRADPPLLGRIHVEDAVCFAEPERAQDDRLSLDRASHRASVGSEGASPPRSHSRRHPTNGWQPGTKPGAAPADAGLRDGRAAASARLTVAAVDAELVLHRARRAVRGGVVAEGRALPIDSRTSAARTARVSRATSPGARPFAGRNGFSRARHSASSA